MKPGPEISRSEMGCCLQQPIEAIFTDKHERESRRGGREGRV